jgi:LysM repeat protein
MFKKLSVMIAIPLALVFVLSACVKSASSVLPPTPTTSNPFNVARPTGLSLVQLYGTQTAQAASTLPAASPNALTALPSPTPTLFLIGTQPTPNGLPGTGVPGTPATPTLQIIVPTSTPGHPASYTLQQGEYPYCIARRFNVNPQELLSLNNVADGQLLQPGFILHIPQTGNPFPGTRALHTHPASFTVSTVDETIYHVACYFGDVDPTSIAAANGLVPPYTLHAGQVLNIP